MKKMTSQIIGQENKLVKKENVSIVNIDFENIEIAENINIKIWPTPSIHIKQNSITGKTKIFYKLTKQIVDLPFTFFNSWHGPS